MLSLSQLLIFMAAAVGLALIATLAATFFTVQQRTTAIVQRLGKFVREAEPGLHVREAGELWLLVGRHVWACGAEFAADLLLLELERIEMGREVLSTLGRGRGVEQVAMGVHDAL